MFKLILYIAIPYQLGKFNKNIVVLKNEKCSVVIICKISCIYQIKLHTSFNTHS